LSRTKTFNQHELQIKEYDEDGIEVVQQYQPVVFNFTNRRLYANNLEFDPVRKRGRPELMQLNKTDEAKKYAIMKCGGEE
jgi:hypothetical protein